MMNDPNVKIAGRNASDIDALVELRLAYLNEDTGGLTEGQTTRITAQLYKYLEEHLHRDMSAYFYVDENGRPLSTVFLVRLEKPANVHFENGKTAYLMNVFTYEDYRGRGYASAILEVLLEDARQEGITCIDVSSTPMGRALYMKNGFTPRINTEMRIEL